MQAPMHAKLSHKQRLSTALAHRNILKTRITAKPDLAEPKSIVI